MIATILTALVSDAARGLGLQPARGEEPKPNLGTELSMGPIGMAVFAGLLFFGLLDAAKIQAQQAQELGEPLPSFEVASIRRSRPGENTSFHVAPNRLTFRNYLTQHIIELAYGRDLGEFGFIIPEHNLLLGGPDWMRAGEFGYEGYDIDAKVDDSVAEKFGKDCGPAFFNGPCSYRQPMISMLQVLLADRFKLKVRPETKEGPVYGLVVAKGGAKFLQTIFPLADSGATPPNSTLQPLHPQPCPVGMACIQAYTSMGRIADRVSRDPQVGRPVIDQTGLKGGYYIKLQWAREQSRGGISTGQESGNAGMGIAPPLIPSGPSLLTAIQEQLGLKLKPTKGPVETLVIEHIERPSEN